MAKLDREQRIVYIAEQELRAYVNELARDGITDVEVFGNRLHLNTERKFGDIESVQRYVDQLAQQSWFRDRWPGFQPVTVRASRNRPGNVRASASANTKERYINLSQHGGGMSSQMRELIVLHEIAHLVPDRGVTGHGIPFQTAFLDLLAGALGEEYVWLMRIRLSEAKSEVDGG